MTNEQELEQQRESASEKIIAFFKQWDTAGIPSRTELNKTKKDDLILLIESYRDNPPYRGSRPKVGDAVKMLLTDKELDLISKDEFAAMLREAFQSRGLKCEIKTMDWYPSARGFSAVPRRR